MITAMPGQLYYWTQVVIVIFLTLLSDTLADDCPDMCSCSGKSVDCSGNDLLQIPSGIPAATRILTLDNNKIETLELSVFLQLTKLRMLHLKNNNIQQLSEKIFSNTKLRTLDLGSNQLASLPHNVFSSLDKLTSLDLSGNNLQAIQGEMFKGLTKLQYLSLNTNNISSITDDTFHDLQSLKHVTLRENPLRVADNLFANNPGLLSLELTETQLQSFPTGLPAGLRNLQLGNNNISSVTRDNLKHCVNTEIIILEQNNIAWIEDDTFKDMLSLIELWLNHNNLQTIPAGLPVGLVHLHLDNNKITSIKNNTFPTNSQLKTLSLQSNALEQVYSYTFRNLQTLNELFLGGNYFRVLRNNTFSSLQNLKSLSLMHQDLEIIEEDVFNGLSKLTSLDLSYILMSSARGIKGNIFQWLSKLSKLTLQESPEIAAKFLSSPEMLSSLGSIQELNLMDNTISTLSSNSFLRILGKIKTLKLPGNPFHCDRSLIWLKHIVNLERSKFFMPDEIVCHTPEKLRGQMITSVSSTDFVPTTTVILPPTTNINEVVSQKLDMSSTMPLVTMAIQPVVNHSSMDDMTNQSYVQSNSSYLDANITNINTTVEIPSTASTLSPESKQQELKTTLEEEVDNFVIITVVTSLSTATVIILIAVGLMVLFHRNRHVFRRDFEYCQENEVEFYVSDGSDRPPVKLTREDRGSVTSKPEEDITNELDLNMKVYTWDDQQ